MIPFLGIKAAPFLISAAIGAAIAGSVAWGISSAIISGKNDSIEGLEKAVTAKDDQLKLAIKDVERLEVERKTNRASIEKLNADVEARRADIARVAAGAAETRKDNEELQLKLNDFDRKLKEKKRANPDQVRTTGPIAHDNLCYVMRAPDGSLPAGCANAP